MASISTEYKEVEFYYTTSIKTGLTQWDELNSEGYISDEEQTMMQTELEEFEKLYKSLQDDLAANPQRRSGNKCHARVLPNKAEPYKHDCKQVRRSKTTKK